MTRQDYNKCVDRCADGLYRFMLKGIRDNERARDLVQDAFEKLWVKHPEVEEQKAKSFLFTIAYNNMIDVIRREKRLTEMDIRVTNSLNCTHSYSDLNEALHKAIEQLPKEQQSVLLLRDYEGYSYSEIGEITGLNPSQVKVYIYRARIFMKEYIGSMEKII